MTDIAIGTGLAASFTRIQPKPFESLSAEEKADVIARRAEYDAIEAQRRATMEAADKQHEAITKGTPSWFRSAPNVINLTREQSLEQIPQLAQLHEEKSDQSCSRESDRRADL